MRFSFTACNLLARSKTAFFAALLVGFSSTAIGSQCTGARQSRVLGGSSSSSTMETLMINIRGVESNSIGLCCIPRNESEIRTGGSISGSNNKYLRVAPFYVNGNLVSQAGQFVESGSTFHGQYPILCSTTFTLQFEDDLNSLIVVQATCVNFPIFHDGAITGGTGKYAWYV